jgi:predicted DNA-binding transcriptional regulator AlpA
MRFTLQELLQDPHRVADLPRELVPDMLCQLGAIQTALTVRWLTVSVSPGVAVSPEPEEDVLLDVDRAAERLGTSKDWLYRHADKLPFTVRLGARQLRFSASGIGRYIRQRQGR